MQREKRVILQVLAVVVEVTVVEVGVAAGVEVEVIVQAAAVTVKAATQSTLSENLKYSGGFRGGCFKFEIIPEEATTLLLGSVD